MGPGRPVLHNEHRDSGMADHVVHRGPQHEILHAVEARHAEHNQMSVFFLRYARNRTVDALDRVAKTYLKIAIRKNRTHPPV